MAADDAPSGGGSEARFRALVRNSRDLTVVTDPAGRVLYVSPSSERMLGYTAAELTALGPDQLVRDEDRARVAAALGFVRFSPAARPTLEVRAQHRDGSWRWLELTMTNLLSDASVRGVVLNLRDITARKQAELAAAQATEQFRLSFENAPIGMAMTSIEPATAGRWLRVNQALADMLGHPREYLEGRMYREFTHPEDGGADEAALNRFRTGESATFDTVKRYRHADGHWIWVHLRASMAAGHDGPREYVISQMLDITERRATEERLNFLAWHDPLTGLANRRLLFDRLSLGLARAKRTGELVAVFFLDLDGFKGVNDSYGHDVGDRLLIEVAVRLRDLARESDTLARPGGDEFVLVADGLTVGHHAAAIATRIAHSFRQPFELAEVGSIATTASVGVALSRPGADATDLLREADVAMYRAKKRRANSATRRR